MNKLGGLIPITFGIIGHRDVIDEDLARASAIVERVIKYFRKLYPQTPFIFLTALAAGADSIAAETALSADENLYLNVILPFDLEQYTKTISDDFQSSFSNLINSERV